MSIDEAGPKRTATCRSRSARIRCPARVAVAQDPRSRHSCQFAIRRPSDPAVPAGYKRRDDTTAPATLRVPPTNPTGKPPVQRLGELQRLHSERTGRHVHRDQPFLDQRSHIRQGDRLIVRSVVDSQLARERDQIFPATGGSVAELQDPRLERLLERETRASPISCGDPRRSDRARNEVLAVLGSPDVDKPRVIRIAAQPSQLANLAHLAQVDELKGLGVVFSLPGSGGRCPRFAVRAAGILDRFAIHDQPTPRARGMVRPEDGIGRAAVNTTRRPAAVSSERSRGPAAR